MNAVSLVLRAGEIYRPDEVVLLGDLIDCYSISSFVKDPMRTDRFMDEIEEANWLLDEFDKTFKKAKKIFIFGNHEERLDQYIATQARELYGLLTITELLKLEERGWVTVPYGGYWSVGKLFATHGTISQRNVADAMLTKYGHSVVFGHVHTIQEKTRVNAVGEEMLAFTPGWLGDPKQADYVKDFANWCQGFATVEVEPSGYWWRTQHMIVNGRLCYQGKMLKAA